ncbi:ABC transporter ATP-binding protein [Olivibacter sp. CPCC 100613]|uniref:ABC transporter ATP-binding protein n=1 Tax=Olivibacter sp. CPCC 100613 TaxID=3079931 RepID=UPI002FF68E18
MKTGKTNLLSLLGPYRFLLFLLLLFALISNGLNLWIPKIIGEGIDAYRNQNFSYGHTFLRFGLVVFIVFIFTYLQTIIQTYASECVARDLRRKLTEKIAVQDFTYIKTANPSKLLTNLTADVDSIKQFVAQAVVSIASSIFIIIGVSILLITINWRLALAVIGIIPIIGGTFFFVLRKVRVLFVQSRAVIDRLNKTINESILGAAIIRVVNSQQLEYDKFLESNVQAKGYGLSILRLFAGLIPVIVFTANMAALIILLLGGHFVITTSMSVGDFAAFNSYLALLIFPILVIGFMSNVIAQATASYDRIKAVLEAPTKEKSGVLREGVGGAIRLQSVDMNIGQKPILKDISFSLSAGSRTAIIGPTAAGKTQLLYLLMGLSKQDSGTITFNGHTIDAFDEVYFHNEVGFVFQDSILFNMSIRENIAFSKTVTDEYLQMAIKTAELDTFVDNLPNKLDTMISERGSDLSGGQKQRIMLARALSLNPSILLLDDFTARVDNRTEKNILQNLKKNYPNLTLISVTQKIATAEEYDQIILLMEGEIIAFGKHQELMRSSPEYVQIVNSQQSTSDYEV